MCKYNNSDFRERRKMTLYHSLKCSMLDKLSWLRFSNCKIGRAQKRCHNHYITSHPHTLFHNSTLTALLLGTDLCSPCIEWLIDTWRAFSPLLYSTISIFFNNVCNFFITQLMTWAYNIIDMFPENIKRQTSSPTFLIISSSRNIIPTKCEGSLLLKSTTWWCWDEYN